MGFLNQIFFGSDSRKRAASRLKQDYLTRYGNLATDIERSFDPIISQISAFRQQNISQYRTDLENAISSYRESFATAQQQYGAGMDRALSEMRTGRDSTIEILRQQVRQQERAAKASQAFSGIGMSSFGAGRVEQIGRSGVLQEGAIREQYASQLSALEAQKAAGLSGMTMQFGSGMAQLGTQLATGTSTLFSNYGSQITAAQLARQQQAFGTRATGLGGYFNAATARASLEGQAAAQWGGLGLSALGSWAQGGFQMPNFFGGNGSDASLSAAQLAERQALRGFQ